MPAPAAPLHRILALALALVCGSVQAQSAVVALENPGFDGSAAGWSADVAPDANSWAHWVEDDAGNGAGSGSVEFASTGAYPYIPPLRSHTCIAVLHEAAAAGLRQGLLEVRVRMRYRVLSGAGSVLAMVEQGFSGDDPANDPPCIGPMTGVLPMEARVATTLAFQQFDSGWQPLVGGPLAMLGVGFRPDANGAVFVALIDDVQLELRTSERIFGHGFADQGS